MDRDRILDAMRISPGVGDHDRNASRLGDLKDELIALFQTFNCEREPAELVFAIRIGAGDVANQIRRELPQAGAERVVEPREVVVVGNAIG